MGPRFSSHGRHTFSALVASTAFVLLLAGGAVVAADDVTDTEALDDVAGDAQLKLPTIDETAVAAIDNSWIGPAIAIWSQAEHPHDLDVAAIDNSWIGPAIAIWSQAEHAQ